MHGDFAEAVEEVSHGFTLITHVVQDDPGADGEDH